MSRRAALWLSLCSLVVLLVPGAARAIPAFARKYETSCLTCHTIYPKLTPFGEAFRRNGYRFPGVDSDYQKMPTVPLGQEANKKTFPDSVWPASLPLGSVLALGANGQAFWYPQKGATVPRQNHGTGVSLDDLVAEGHVWAGAALDDTITLWAELTLGGGSADVEHAQVLLNDLVGPRHALNLTVGRGFPTLTSFGPHSSYLGDARLTVAPVTQLYLAAPPSSQTIDPFTLVDNYNGAELTGVVAGYFDYSLGITAGKNTSGIRFSSENVYGHVGYKLGGLRLDGEGTQGPADAMRPWAEDAVTVDLFAFHAREYWGTSDAPVGDTSWSMGGTVRGQLGSAELDVGAYAQRHQRATQTLDAVRTDVEWGELSYVVFPWMVPAVRLERIGLHPTGAPNVSDLHLMPGVAFLLRANIKAVLVANFEWVNGFPQASDGTGLAWSGGNADWGGFVAAPRDPASPGSKPSEVESIALFLAWAM